MAKKSMVQRELKRQKLVEKYAAKRAELKAKGDYVGLSKLPRNWKIWNQPYCIP